MLDTGRLAGFDVRLVVVNTENDAFGKRCEMNSRDNVFLKGFNRYEYAALELCRKYIEKVPSVSCVHCRFFSPGEPATVVAPTQHISMEQSKATISGDCYRFPPSICVINGEVDYSSRPVVSGDDFCGEFIEAKRTTEDICFEGYWKQESGSNP